VPRCHYKSSLPEAYQSNFSELNDSVIYAYGFDRDSFEVVVKEVKDGVIYGQEHISGNDFEIGMKGRGHSGTLAKI